MPGSFLSGNLVATLDPVAGDSINATGDFNGDQKADILTFNTTTGEIKTLLLDGGTSAFYQHYFDPRPAIQVLAFRGWVISMAMVEMRSSYARLCHRD